MKLVYVVGYSQYIELHELCKSAIVNYYESKAVDFKCITLDERLEIGEFEDDGPTVRLGSSIRKRIGTPEETIVQLWEKVYLTQKYLLERYDSNTNFFIHTVTSVCSVNRLNHLHDLVSHDKNIWAGTFLPSPLGPNQITLSGAGILWSRPVMEKLCARYHSHSIVTNDDVMLGAVLNDIPKFPLMRKDFTRPPQSFARDRDIFIKDFLSAVNDGHFHFRFRTNGADEKNRIIIDYSRLENALILLRQEIDQNMSPFEQLLQDARRKAEILIKTL